MPRGGHNKKSNRLKVLEGSPRAQREDRTMKPKPIFPSKAPRGTPKYARLFWNTYAPILTEQGVLKETDKPSWEVLCGIYNTIKTCEETLEKEGLTIEGKRGGENVKHPCISILNQARQLYRLQAAQFGLDPTSRERMEIVDINHEESPMAKILRESWERAKGNEWE